MSKQEQEARRALKARRKELDRIGGRGDEIRRIDQELRIAAPYVHPWQAAEPAEPPAPAPAPRSAWGMRKVPRRPRPMRAGWIRLSAPGANTEWGEFVYEPNGANVSHCGHPTANYPYLVVTRDGRYVLAPNGRAFRLLKDAMAAAEGLA